MVWREKSRTLIIGMLIFAALLTISCNSKEEVEKGTNAGNQPRILDSSGQQADGDQIEVIQPTPDTEAKGDGEEITGEEEESDPGGDQDLKYVKGLPKYFAAEGWLDDNNIFGLTGTNPLRVELNSGDYFPLGFSVWNAQLSPDRKKIAYMNEDGITAANLDGTGKQLVASNQDNYLDGSELGGFIWAPDGSKLLLTQQYEWDADFAIYDLGSKTVKPVQIRLEDYFLTDAKGWAADGRIIFDTRASRKKDGTQEYGFGYRQDIAVFDPSTDEFKLITDTADGEFIDAVRVAEEGILFKRSYQDEEGNMVKEEIITGMMDFTGKVLWQADLGQVKSLNLSPDGRSLAYIVDDGREGMNKNYRLMVRKEDQDHMVMEFEVGDHFKGPFWSLDGQRILVSYAKNSDGENGGYQDVTLILTPGTK